MTGAHPVAATPAGPVDATLSGGRLRRALTGPVPLCAAFLAVHLVLAAVNLFDQAHHPMGDVTGVYRAWVDEWHATGLLVGIDTSSVYPVGALLPILAAGMFGDGPYPLAWLGIVVLLDAVATVLLARRSLPLAWWWIAFTACLGPIALGRIDSIALPVAIAGVLVVASRPAVASALFTVAAWIKVWPAALVVAMLVAGRRTAAVLTAAAVTSAVFVATALLAGAGANVVSFVSAQAGRGLQVEAPVTSLWLWEAAAGVGGTTVYYDQDLLTFQVIGRGVADAAAGMTVVLAVAVLTICGLGLLARRRGANPGEVLALTALGFVGAAIALNKVGSPQYCTWYVAPVLLGLLAAPRRFRWPAGLVLVIAALTQVIYPWVYDAVLEVRPAALVLLDVRNLLELVLLGWTLAALAVLQRPALTDPRPEAGPTPAGRAVPAA
ncbi:MAG: hypothetical protein QOE37_1380 [Microbacteriaceae bacterium]|nr:hypothetical protein [Microbacteriaceae bacterium]